MAIVSWSGFSSTKPGKFPIRTITVTVMDRNHVDPVLIKTVVSNNTAGGFFSLQVNRLRASLLTIPWIYDVSFRRVWPDQLLISVQEQQAIARWGSNALLNAQADIFIPPLNSFPKNLPLLSGPADSQQEVLRCLQQLNQMLSPLDLQITTLSLSARHAWQLTLMGKCK